jgi:hypothetical protein
MKTQLAVMAICLLSAIIALCVYAAYRKHSKSTRNMCNAANQPGVGTVDGIKTFSAAAALTNFAAFAAAYTNAYQPAGRFALVVQSSAGVVDVSTSAGDFIIGVCLDYPDNAGDPLAVRLINGAGSCRMVAAGAISLNAQVQSNGDGSIKTATTGGYVVGIALQAAGAAGDIIEVMLVCSITAHA